jgi:hypothetical protein
MTTARGHRLATSLGGTLTGRGADLIVLDDPQKPEEALSEASRNHAAQWFDTTLLSRLDSKTNGAVILVMQRLHEDDLAGRLLEKSGWHHLKIAAIAQQDERVQVGPRRRFRRKVGTIIDSRRESLEALDNLRQSMGALHFSYQQEPIPLEGNLIKLEWFKEYEVALTYTHGDKLVISIDTAMKGEQLADFSVATAWLARGEQSAGNYQGERDHSAAQTNRNWRASLGTCLRRPEQSHDVLVHREAWRTLSVLHQCGTSKGSQG